MYMLHANRAQLLNAMSFRKIQPIVSHCCLNAPSKFLEIGVLPLLLLQIYQQTHATLSIHCASLKMSINDSSPQEAQRRYELRNQPFEEPKIALFAPRYPGFCLTKVPKEVRLNCICRPPILNMNKKYFDEFDKHAQQHEVSWTKITSVDPNRAIGGLEGNASSDESPSETPFQSYALDQIHIFYQAIYAASTEPRESTSQILPSRSSTRSASTQTLDNASFAATPQIGTKATKTPPNSKSS